MVLFSRSHFRDTTITSNSSVTAGKVEPSLANVAFPVPSARMIPGSTRTTPMPGNVILLGLLKALSPSGVVTGDLPSSHSSSLQEDVLATSSRSASSLLARENLLSFAALAKDLLAMSGSTNAAESVVMIKHGRF